MSFKQKKEDIEKKYQIGGGEWLNLVEGANRVRLVSDCVDYGNHYEGGKFTICIGKEKCLLCQKGNKPNVQFLVWAIDRKDGQVKLFRFGYTIYKQIMAYKDNPDYKFETLPNYDFTIERTGKGKDTDYRVIAARSDTELTEKEKAEILEKIKDPKEIIEKMKAKVEMLNYEPDDVPVEEEEPNV